ncbi:hypothetical protein GTY67_28575 [Streptomyces sp. SID8374]|uniref:hypothetical protein n=1 Tax=Streptomyces sp. SID8374 TaxID=2690354 RepID=UPI00136A9E61|nr:hypothetical protein [Streptomyces sp. SID8374]MYX17305.1 hypothetical protein [Streptomyces sp. SID8374]
MSDADPNARRVFSGVEASGPHPLEYRFAHAKNGNRHLVVVFANLNAPGEWGWANGVLDRTRANILWIRDQFDGQNSYYLCREMDFTLEQSVINLISRVMNALGLTPDECTMFGSSKGGTAALHFGLKYGFRNIVASVPQFRIGSFVSESMPGAARLMMGEVTEEKVRVLDSVLPEVVRTSPNRDANIYLISSPQDEQYTRHVEPFLGLFRDYTNFNFVYNDSPLIAGHGKVTLRNLPTMMGLLNLLVDGITPRIGVISNGGEQPERDTSAIDAYLKATSQVQAEAFPRPAVTLPAQHAEVPGNQLRFAGSAPGAVRVSMWENGKYLGSPPVQADGSWSWEPEKTWSPGRHVIRLFAVNAQKFHSERTEIVFTALEPAHAPVHRRPATPVITAPFPQQQVRSQGIILTGYGDGGTRIVFRREGAVLGTTTTGPDGTWFWEPGWTWPEGQHTVECSAVDGTGAESPAAAIVFTATGALGVPVNSSYAEPRY